MDYANFKKWDNYNPRETANIFSIITFFYNYRILKQGKKQDLQEKDIYNVIPEFDAERLGNKLETKWRQERKKKSKASIIKCLISCFGWTYVMYTLVQLLFGTVILLLTPTIFSKFVAYFQPGQNVITTMDAYKYAFALLGLQLFNVFYTNNFQQLITEYSIKVRTAVCSLIYRKALRLDSVAFSQMSIGKIVTLMSKDVFSIDSGVGFIKEIIIGLLQLAVASYLLYQRVGVSAFPALGVILVIIPLQLFIGKKTTDRRIITAKRTDERFRLLQETLSAIKIIKMYTWETFFERLIHAARLKETDQIKIVYYLKAFIVTFGTFTINLAFYVLLIFYIARGNPVDPETVYYVQTCLGAIKLSIGLLMPMGIAQTADMFASFSRIQTYLDAAEYKKPVSDQEFYSSQPSIYLDNVKVTIQGKEVLKSVSLNLQEGLLLITGNVGSGKSALLKAILGEYPIASGRMNVWGSLSYATEEPWVFPSTIRQNILFGQAFNRSRYEKVLEACALTYDLKYFEKHDQTIIGDRGINLSKGQQARICLARSVYRESDIYLLDDVLSSLDNHVNKHIFEKCIRGLLRDKICILVTNNINNIKAVDCSEILVVENGSTLNLEQQKDALDKRITYYIDEEGSRDNLVPESDESISSFMEEAKETDLLLNGSVKVDQNLYHEKNKEGKVLWSNYSRYYRFIGGAFVTVYLFVVFLIAQFCISYSEKMISIWVNLEPNITKLVKSNQTETEEYMNLIQKREQFLNIYTILILAGLVFIILRSYSSFFFCMNGARKLHRAMVKAMLHTYMHFFDDHFIGNIINRLSKDFHIIDEYMPFLVLEAYRLVFMILGVIALVASVNWILFIPSFFFIIKLYFVQRLYLPAGRSLRRLEAATRSPIIGYLNSTLEGLAIVRASEQQDQLRTEFDMHQDVFTSTCFMNQTTMRFFTFILDLFGAFFMGGIALKFLIFSQGTTAGDVGLALTQSTMLAGLIQYAVRQLTEIENVMTSVERVLEYADAELESKTGKKLENWPLEGAITFEDVCLTYKFDGRSVLNNVSFNISGGTKLGIVGRTGAGKSSIISILFRLYDYEGFIRIDGEDISKLSLDFLRSKISIIPQDPILFSGTIRSNIDPFQQFSDKEIWSALEKVHIKSFIKTLSQPVKDLASMYSSGQKQLLCLARAVVQNNKIIVLDEATANIDPETDLLLQKTVEECFKKCTVLTIAHRLNSVMKCDKILVLDNGRIVEFDEPKVLIGDSNGILAKMLPGESL
ncbi:ATP-binding cassette sub-family C member 4-like [Anthonomus grandis grandis]|uniref:ATP-binding cassette sub-family C member 4-like n=1 Tax=Anthonomus grandis grandis TaxID=2921223 RepID=UPI0021661EB6|nr:ATP-binding cassette sub-family C member 4-like [Anthonomus grandis grandis]